MLAQYLVVALAVVLALLYAGAKYLPRTWRERLVYTLTRGSGKGRLADWLGGADDTTPKPAADPTASARGPGKPALPKRFYAAAGLAEAEGGLRLTLDGRPTRQPRDWVARFEAHLQSET